MSHQREVSPRRQYSLVERMSVMPESDLSWQRRSAYEDPYYPHQEARDEGERLPKENHNYRYISERFIDFTRPKRYNDELTVPYSLIHGRYTHHPPSDFNPQASRPKWECKSCRLLNKDRPLDEPEIVCVTSPDYARCALCICLNLPFGECHANTPKSRLREEQRELQSGRVRKRTPVGVNQESSSLSPRKTKRSRSATISPEVTLIKRIGQTDSLQIAGCSLPVETDDGHSNKEAEVEVNSTESKGIEEVEKGEENNTLSEKTDEPSINELYRTNYLQRQESLKLKAQLKAVQDDHDKSLQNLTKLQQELNKQKEENKNLIIDRNDFSAVKENLESVKKQNKSLKADIVELKEGLWSRDEANDTLKRDVISKENDLIERDKVIQELKRELRTVKEGIQNTAEKVWKRLETVMSLTMESADSFEKIEEVANV